MTERWRHPLNEALDMADAFREGVPLGWQRAFVALADAYRDVLADHAALQDELVALRRGPEAMLTAMEAAMEAAEAALPPELRYDPARTDAWMNAALAEPPAHELDLDLEDDPSPVRVHHPTGGEIQSIGGESFAPRVYRARQTRNGMEITRSNDWPAPENDAGPDWTYPPLPDINAARGDRRAMWALRIALVVALAVAGFVYFLG